MWKKEEGVSYSTLIRDIDNKKIKQLDLVPAQREVRVVYDDGRKVSVPIFQMTTGFCGPLKALIRP